MAQVVFSFLGAWLDGPELINELLRVALRSSRGCRLRRRLFVGIERLFRVLIFEAELCRDFGGCIDGEGAGRLGRNVFMVEQLLKAVAMDVQRPGERCDGREQALLQTDEREFRGCRLLRRQGCDSLHAKVAVVGETPREVEFGGVSRQI